MQISIHKTAEQSVLRLQGRFDYESRRDFDSAAREALLADPKTIVVNMMDVEYMDSSALGMLLVLRDKARIAGKKVALGETQGFVKKVLDVANFHKLFE
jgi:anti-anti-sigma factor